MGAAGEAVPVDGAPAVENSHHVVVRHHRFDGVVQVGKESRVCSISATAIPGVLRGGSAFSTGLW